MHKIRVCINLCLISKEHAVKGCQDENSNMLSENKIIKDENIRLIQDLHDLRQIVNDTRDESGVDKELLSNISQLQSDNEGFLARIDILSLEKEAIELELGLCQNGALDLSLREKSLIAKNDKLILDKNQLRAERGEFFLV